MKKFITITSGLMTMSIIAAIIAIGMQGPPTVDPVQHKCLAMNIYHESRSEVIEGQIAVAHVTLNRVAHNKWSNTICGVIARDVMIGNTVDPTSGATFYHANYVNPKWAKQMEVSKVIGYHIFYKWDGTWD